MDYSTTELTEAKRQIDSILHKLNETVTTLEAKEEPTRYKSQLTLAKRRIHALTIAVALIEAQLHSDT
ncbi:MULTISPECIES: hypothetical protein [Exiguobacterium]|uniref:hypothetical protein n=1 Tax=Exiguobacterium TaxID=33986 RepID=UPI001BEA8353|nr:MULTISPECIES: hypothetical protein [Exiguobacterium]MCT4776037.1 hypothetical protein [Exiguobacterium aquaticum]MCT4788053.1 hypothetical protein [Exiguobacterium mexicanum]